MKFLTLTLILFAVFIFTGQAFSAPQAKVRLIYFLNDLRMSPSALNFRLLRLDSTHKSYLTIQYQLTGDTLTLDRIPDDESIFLEVKYLGYSDVVPIEGMYFEGTWRIAARFEKSYCNFLKPDYFCFTVTVSSGSVRGCEINTYEYE